MRFKLRYPHGAEEEYWLSPDEDSTYVRIYRSHRFEKKAWMKYSWNEHSTTLNAALPDDYIDWLPEQ